MLTNMFGAFRAILIACLLPSVVSLSVADSTSRLVASFSPNPNGAYLGLPLVAGLDGNYYGVTSAGGAYNIGTIFKITPAGVLTTLASFNPATTGQDPSSFLLARDGNFYGTTIFYGQTGQGTIFKMTPDGTLSVLYAFSGNGSSGTGNPNNLFQGQGQDDNLYTALPYGPLVKVSTSSGAATTIATPPAGFSPTFQGQDGYFYGSYNAGGNVGLVKVSPTGDMKFLYSFGGFAAPYLIQAPNGTIFGSLAASSAYPYGSIFSLSPTGTLTTLFAFQSTDSSTIPLQIILGQDGNFYGIGQGAGSNFPLAETIFKATPTGKVTTIATATSSGGRFIALTQLANGDIFWNTDGIGTLQRLHGGVVSTLYTFSTPDLATPTGPLIQASNGNFYGTTTHGGTFGFGGVFQVTPAGKLSTLVSFPTEYAPYGLTQGSDGNLYGTNLNGAQGFDQTGSLFKVTPTGALSTVYTFQNYSDGYTPNSTLVKSSDGNLYGLTVSGGANNAGTFFKVSTSGAFSVIASLDPALTAGNSFFPFPIPFILGKDGNFYGVTNNSIFKITPAGKSTVLYTFTSNSFPAPSGLAQGQDGNFYGTAANGGAYNQGYLYKLSAKGVFTSLYSFSSNSLTASAAYPSAFALSNDGNFYVTTLGAASDSPGALVQITPAGVAQLIPYGATLGDHPYSILQGSDGTLYGSTQTGGTAASGTIFNVTADLLDGTIIGTPGSFSYEPGNTIDKVFDGDLTTYFDAPSPGNGDWVGLDLGSVQNITAIAYVPRPHFESRMIGGVFQGSNTADFSSGVVNLAPPIKTFPGDTFNTIFVNGAFRYVRYLSPDKGFGNINELQFFSGPPAGTP